MFYDFLQKTRGDVEIAGIAGGAKSSIVNDIASAGERCILIAPKRRTVVSHRARFANQCTHISTADSLLLSPRGGRRYYGYSRTAWSHVPTADYLIFDEAHSASQKLIDQAVACARGIGARLIYMGDPKQSTRETVPPTIDAGDTLHITTTYRGTDANRKLITDLYNIGTDTISQAELFALLEKHKVKYDWEMPENRGQTIATPLHDIGDIYLAMHPDFDSGKVSQRQKDMIDDLVGGADDIVQISERAVTHITCIGIQVTGDYDVLLPRARSYSTSAIYTMLSRQTDISQLTVHFVSVPRGGWLRRPTVAQLPAPLVPRKRSAHATLADLGIPADTADRTELQVDARTYQQYLRKCAPDSLSDAQTIVCERGITVCVAPPPLPEGEKPAAEKTRLYMSKIIRHIPNLACDPTLLQYHDGTLDIQPTGLPMYRIPYTPDRRGVAPAGTITDVDITGSYYQMVARCIADFGGGPALPYDSDTYTPADYVAYGTATVDGARTWISSDLVPYLPDSAHTIRYTMMRRRVGTSNPALLQQISDITVQHRWLAGYKKSQLNFWGIYMHPRFSMGRTVGKQNVVVDHDKESGLFATMIDILSHQYIYAKKLADYYGATSVCADGVSGCRATADTPHPVDFPDVKITRSSGGAVPTKTVVGGIASYAPDGTYSEKIFGTIDMVVPPPKTEYVAPYIVSHATKALEALYYNRKTPRPDSKKMLLYRDVIQQLQNGAPCTVVNPHDLKSKRKRKPVSRICITK